MSDQYQQIRSTLRQQKQQRINLGLQKETKQINPQEAAQVTPSESQGVPDKSKNMRAPNGTIKR
jgi:hypothetical protein